MRVLLQANVTLVGLLIAAVLPTIKALYPGENFVWSSGDDCPTGYDYCGMLEFCMKDDYSTYGYRLPCLEEECECVGSAGPLIRLIPGNKYKMTLRNAAKRISTVTNIHTHGLHIVGHGDSDDVVRQVAGQSCLDYTWDIAPDHPGGTYWYHAHHHGHTEEQVAGGAHGMLIVEDNPLLNSDIPEWASNELLLQIAFTWDGMLGNGKQNEVIEMEANQWYRLRVSVVNAEAEPMPLKFDIAAGDCEAHRVASDGIWRSTVPGPKGEAFELTGASRADFAVKCKLPNTQVALTYGNRPAATLMVGEKFSGTRYTMSRWQPNRPDSLMDMRDEIVPDVNKLQFQMAYDNVNGEMWNPQVPYATIAYDEVHEWTLVGTSGHPFHLHLYHVQVVSPGGCGAHEYGQFYDTISAPEDCVVRFRTADFGQRCVLHCHILFHEDNGSMTWVNVEGPNMPRNDVESFEYSCPDYFPTAAPSVAPTAVLSSSPTVAQSQIPTVVATDGDSESPPVSPPPVSPPTQTPVNVDAANTPQTQTPTSAARTISSSACWIIPLGIVMSLGW